MLAVCLRNQHSEKWLALSEHKIMALHGSITENKKGAEAFKRAMKEIEMWNARVGFFENSKYESGEPVAYIAAIQEFGYEAGNLPSRSFMRTTQKEKRHEWAMMAQKGFTSVAAGRMSAESVYKKLGMAGQAAVVKKIRSIKSPALKESTVDTRKRRKANGGKGATMGIRKPLVDTGVMLAAVNHQVVNGHAK